MTTLSDRDIRAALRSGAIALDPFDPAWIQPASVDVPLGPRVLVRGYREYLTQLPYVLRPLQFALGVLATRLTLGPRLRASIEGKSTAGRHGLAVHITAGYVDPGWDGYLTVELVNLGPRSIRLDPYVLVAQLAFHRLSSAAERPYGHAALGSHYQGATEPQAPGPLRVWVPPEAPC